MSWQGIVGHDKQADFFRCNLKQGRLGSSFLFLGPTGIGKRKFALKFAQALFCQQNDSAQLQPCGDCPTCRQVLADTHPDLHLIGVDRAHGKRSIIKAQLVGGKKATASESSQILEPQTEHPSEVDTPAIAGGFDIQSGDLSTYYHGLCYQLNLKPAQANRQIAIIDDADCMQDEAANALLKTLEEPPPGSVLILIASNPQKILTTIHSRCQTILFQTLADDQVKQVLLDSGAVETEDQARVLASLAGGSVEVALATVDGKLVELRQEVCDLLPVFAQQPQRLAAVVESYVSAPKDSPAQRQCFQQVADVILRVFHLMLLQRTGVEYSADEIAQSTVATMLQNWRGDEETIIACIDRTLDAVTQLNANANIKTLVDAWVDDLAQIQLCGGYMVPEL
jgi:DNA polymerase-3 subunit delta'